MPMRRQVLLVEELGVDAHGHHLLVVGAVEDPDAPALGQRAHGAPQEVVVELLGRGRLERDDLDPLWVDTGHHVLDRRVLAGCVHRLQDDEQRVAVARPQKLLGVRELGRPLLAPPLRVRLELVPAPSPGVVATCPPRVPGGEARGPSGADDELVEQSTPDVQVVTLLALGHRPSIRRNREAGRNV
jgi:hypothetical protein